MAHAGPSGSSTRRQATEGHWYDAVLALLDDAVRANNGQPTSADWCRARDLAEVARRVLDLDAEDFTAIAREHREAVGAEAGGSSFPAEPRDDPRGPGLAGAAVRADARGAADPEPRRGEPLQVVVTAHLIGEYLIQLAWESTLGHSGDPLRSPTSSAVAGGGPRTPSCPSPSALRSTASGR